MNQTSERIGSRLHRLSEVSMMKQVEPLSYALFPGYHCPLMGAMLTIGKIRDAVMLVIGPDECTYYTKMATSDGGRMASEGCQIVSVVLDQHDVTFGCKEAITEAFHELNEEYHPKCVFAVTTCVPEVTGDDVESMAAVFSSQYGFPVVVVHAENFKTDDHMPGIEHTLTGCLPLMQPKECNGSVNVLGLRLGDFSKTETCRILRENGVPVGLTLPGSCSVSDIQNAPTAKVNLVVHPVGLPLAKAMDEKFGIPYVDFERFSRPDSILTAYEQLFAALEKPMPEQLRTAYADAVARSEAAAPKLKGLTYFSGNTALCNFELHAFLAELGMEPVLLQISDLEDIDRRWRDMILAHCDPYVTRAANMGALGYMYPILKPDMNIGAGTGPEMRAVGTVMVRMMNAYNMLGFEVNQMVIAAMLKAAAERSKQ